MKFIELCKPVNKISFNIIKCKKTYNIKTERNFIFKIKIR